MYIDELFILTRDISGQKDFYCKTLGLELLGETDTGFSIKMGRSVLNMDYSADATPYHFAINIPFNLVTAALHWLHHRVAILKDGDREEQDFTAWNARALYFYDPDRNIVELIGRRDLHNHSEREFGPDGFLALSEIGIPVEDIEKVYNLVNQVTGLTIYSGNFNNFCAIGDPNGLLICINRKEKGWFPTNDTAYPSDFRLSMTARDRGYRLAFEKGNLFVTYTASRFGPGHFKPHK